jgi:hypothetical protein
MNLESQAYIPSGPSTISRSPDVYYIFVRMRTLWNGRARGHLLLHGDSRLNTPLKYISVRDIEPGMIVQRGDENLVVRSVTALDGSNGEPPEMIGGDYPSAMAIKIEFENHDPLICHPSEKVPATGKKLTVISS